MKTKSQHEITMEKAFPSFANLVAHTGYTQVDFYSAQKQVDGYTNTLGLNWCEKTKTCIVLAYSWHTGSRYLCTLEAV